MSFILQINTENTNTSLPSLLKQKVFFPRINCVCVLNICCVYLKSNNVVVEIRSKHMRAHLPYTQS